MATNLRGAYKQTELLGANGDHIRPWRAHDEQIAQQKGAKSGGMAGAPGRQGAVADRFDAHGHVMSNRGFRAGHDN
jgi:hypothetical protein